MTLHQKLSIPKAKTFFILFFCLLLFGGRQSELCAQTYPVQLITQLTPPYSGYVLDYADPASEKLRIILQFNDFTVPQYNVRLKLEIKGNGFTITTKQFFIPPPIVVQPGVPVLISGSDLAPYLNSSNLDFVGINQSQYEQGKALPEGYYSICIKAFDYYQAGNTQVSNESCSQAWFMLSDPPILNLPLCKTTVTPQTPQNILFQWTPMNMGSPNSAFSTEYDFELWEIRPDSTANPEQVVLSTAPIYKAVTSQTFINYGIIDPELTLYMKYAWRVRARDLNGYDVFKNKGYSQVYTFSYGNAGNVIADAYALTLTAQGVTHRLGKCIWNLQSAFSSYLLQVRKQGTTNWFDYRTNLNTEKIPNLEPNTIYESRVQGQGTDIPISQWSNTATFTTLKDPVYNCNDQSLPTDPLQATPLPIDKAITGLIIQTGQFEVVATEISSIGAGWFRGKGYVKVFGGFPLAVQWKNIYIDDNNRHQQGVIEAITLGIDPWMHQWDVAQAEENATYTDGTIDSVYINGDEVCITVQGNSEVQCHPIADDANVMIVRDEEGNQYTVTLLPKPEKVEGPSNYLIPSTDALDASDSLIVTFSASSSQRYGFDKKKYTAFGPNYEFIKLNNGKKYFVPYKSIEQNQSDEVIADIQIKNFDKNLLSFKSLDGALLASVVGSSVNQYKVTVSEVESIYAWYNNKKIGKLNIASYKPIDKKLVIVPVNNSSVSSSALQNDLNSIYNQANVNWTVSTSPNFTFDMGSDGLQFPDATLMSKYSDEMRALRDAYRQQDTAYDKNANYVFVVPAFTDPIYKGYMVRGRAVGFMTSDASAKDLAHELAHGAFGLEHTFPAIPKSMSNNLMDYSTDVNLTKKQWDGIHSSKFIYNWLDSEEDAAIADAKACVLEILNKLKTAYQNKKTVEITYVNMPFGVTGLQIMDVYLAGIYYPYIGIVSNPTTITPKYENIIEFHKNGWSKNENHGLKIDDKLTVYVPELLVPNIKYFLTSPADRNLLLFVGGYIPDQELLTKHPDVVYQSDVWDYWDGMDANFINTITTKNTVYASGSDFIWTSNHITHEGAAKSNASMLFFSPFLNTTPNLPGFVRRYNNGKTGGLNMLAKLYNGTITCRQTLVNGKIKILDTVDVVAHSMGFAYSLGMIHELQKANVHVGRFYIIAPENGCSGTLPDNLEEAWQYGSDENIDPIKLQDGVAPQCPVNGFDKLGMKGGRIRIPDNQERGWIESHLAKNYGWIFTTLKGKPGDVKKRE